MHNIEKSAFKKGEYIGYANGVWHIKRTNSSYGNWIARHRDDPQMPVVWAFRLKDLSEKLTHHSAV